MFISWVDCTIPVATRSRFTTLIGCQNHIMRNLSTRKRRWKAPVKEMHTNGVDGFNRHLSTFRSPQHVGTSKVDLKTWHRLDRNSAMLRTQSASLVAERDCAGCISIDDASFTRTNLMQTMPIARSSAEFSERSFPSVPESICNTFFRISTRPVGDVEPNCRITSHRFLE